MANVCVIPPAPNAVRHTGDRHDVGPRPIRTGEAGEHAERFIWLVAALHRVGMNPDATLREMGLDPHHLNELGRDVPLVWFRGLWEGICGGSGETGIGLRIARSIVPSDFGTFGELLATSVTLANALLLGTRFIRLVSRTTELELHVHGERAILAYNPRYPDLCHPEQSELVIGCIGSIARCLCGKNIVPTEVRFAHSAPPNVSVHASFFNTPVRFDQSHHGYVFPTALLQTEILGSQRHRHAEIESNAQRRLRSVLVPPSFADRTLSLLQAKLRHGEPSSIEVASALGLHPKTLNRRLRSEGTNYQRLLNQLRHRLAEHYLSQPELSISRVTRLLGYSENSAFCRAFKRWTGCAPQDFRRATLMVQ
ncbi:MAG: AraC family transcriptional regulator [Nannocystaceae bacterium]